MEFLYDDGGRKKAGFKGKTGDCVVRAIAIASQEPYRKIYNRLNELAKKERIGKYKKKKSNSRTGIYNRTIKKYMKEAGYAWVPTMFIGSGCRVHLKTSELPKGRLIVKVTKWLPGVYFLPSAFMQKRLS